MNNPAVSFFLIRHDQPHPTTPMWTSMCYYISLTGIEIHAHHPTSVYCKTTKAHLELLFGITQPPDQKMPVSLMDDRVEHKYWICAHPM